ncbi:hypothetical protein D3C76_1646820 [compost metagenome]
MCVLYGNQLLHFRLIGLLQAEGIGHHLLNRTRPIVALHRLQDTVAGVEILLAYPADIAQHLLGRFILQGTVQVAEDPGDTFADRLQLLF